MKTTILERRNHFRSRAEVVTGSRENFRSFGEQMQVIARASKGSIPEQRRLTDLRSALGASEVVDSQGGFLVQPEFTYQLLERTYAGELLSMMTVIQQSSSSNRIHIPMPDETSRASGSRWGGLRATWLSEAATIPLSKPRLKSLELGDQKLGAAVAITEELLEDSSVLEAFLTRGFQSEMGFSLEDASVNGTGAGEPLGIVRSTSLITVSKESGQSSGTIVRENLKKMWSRCWLPSRKNAVWLVSEQVDEAISDCYTAVNPVIGAYSAAAATANQAYVPAGVSGQYALLYGRPILPVEYCAALGTVGDILLVDLAQYLVLERPLNVVLSAHVEFVTGEMVLRFILRCNGQPVWYSPMTPKNGSQTQSPFVALQTR